jgi:hypothetical protein
MDCHPSVSTATWAGAGRVRGRRASSTVSGDSDTWYLRSRRVVTGPVPKTARFANVAGRVQSALIVPATRRPPKSSSPRLATQGHQDREGRERRGGYSNRSASSGCSRAALRAGHTPKAMPTTTLTPKATGIETPGTTNGTCKPCATPQAPTRSRTMPTPSPIAERVVASTRNCVRMSRGARADREAHAYLAGSFGHRHEHDVHDADAGHERHGGHACKQVARMPITDWSTAWMSRGRGPKSCRRRLRRCDGGGAGSGSSAPWSRRSDRSRRRRPGWLARGRCPRGAL